MPFDGEGGDVGEDETELSGGDVAGKRNGVEAGAADGGVREQTFERDAALAPAFGEAGVFENGKHEAVVAGLFHVDGFDGSGDGGRSRERSGRAKRLCDEIFDGRADGDIFQRGGRKIDSDIGPAGFHINTIGVALDFDGFAREHAG